MLFKTEMRISCSKWVMDDHKIYFYFECFTIDLLDGIMPTGIVIEGMSTASFECEVVRQARFSLVDVIRVTMLKAHIIAFGLPRLELCSLFCDSYTEFNFGEE